MKIYFTASARGKKELGDNYRAIYEVISELGHRHVDDLIMKVDSESFYQGSHKDQVALYDKAMKLISLCDIMVLEVSVHSLSMGFVMQKALESGKPVIALYLPNCMPYFALGIVNDKLQVTEYTKGDLKQVLKLALEYAVGLRGTRFTLILDGKVRSKLDKVAEKGQSRSDYIRSLILADTKRSL